MIFSHLNKEKFISRKLGLKKNRGGDVILLADIAALLFVVQSKMKDWESMRALYQAGMVFLGV